MSSHALALLQAAFGAQTLVGNGDGSGTPPPKRGKRNSGAGAAGEVSSDMKKIFESVEINFVRNLSQIRPFKEEVPQIYENTWAEMKRLKDFLLYDVDEFDLYFRHINLTYNQMVFILTKIKNSQTIKCIRFNLLDVFVQLDPSFSPWWMRELHELLGKVLKENKSITKLILHNTNYLKIHQLHHDNYIRDSIYFLRIFMENLSPRLKHFEIHNLFFHYMYIYSSVNNGDDDGAVITQLKNEFFIEWNTAISNLKNIKIIKIVEPPILQYSIPDEIITDFQRLLTPFKRNEVLEIIDLSQLIFLKFKILKERVHWDEILGAGQIEEKPDGMRYIGKAGRIYDIFDEYLIQNITLGRIIVPYEMIRPDHTSVTGYTSVRGLFNWRRWQLRPMEWTLQNLEIPWVKKQRGFWQKVNLIKRKLQQLTGLSDAMIYEIFKNFSEESIELNIDEQFTPLRELLRAKGVTDDELSERLGRHFPRNRGENIGIQTHNPIEVLYFWVDVDGY